MYVWIVHQARGRDTQHHAKSSAKRDDDGVGRGIGQPVLLVKAFGFEVSLVFDKGGCRRCLSAGGSCEHGSGGGASIGCGSVWGWIEFSSIGFVSLEVKTGNSVRIFGFHFRNIEKCCSMSKILCGHAITKETSKTPTHNQRDLFHMLTRTEWLAGRLIAT